MYIKWPESEPWEALREAILPALAPALAAAPPGRTLVLREGSLDSPPLTLTRQGLILTPSLLGPDVYTGTDQHWLTQTGPALAPLALDRWRRCIGLILEGIRLHRLAEQLGVSPDALPLAWWTVGAVADEVDRAAPQLGWLWQEAAGLLMQPEVSMAAQPRRGAWFFRWRRLQGKPLPLTGATPPRLDPQEWAAFGQWCRDLQSGPAASAPLPIEPASPRAAPTEPLPPLSHHPVQWSAGPAGLRVSGAALAPRVLLGSGQEMVAVIGTVEGGRAVLSARPARPVGRWEMRSGQANQRMGVAEGIELHFLSGGRLEIVLGNAWLGPVDAESMSIARQFGASGTGSGRWQVQSLSERDGEGVLVLSELDIEQLSIHPRRKMARRFALPAQNQIGRVRRLLTSLSGQPVTFRLQDGELRLSGELRNYTFQIRLTPA